MSRTSLPSTVEYFNSVISPRHPSFGRFSENSDSAGKVVCPFHDDIAPSMGIIPGTDIFHCFGCSAHGNVVELHRRYLRIYHHYTLTYDESLEDLCALFDVDLPPEQSWKKIRDLVQQTIDAYDSNSTPSDDSAPSTPSDDPGVPAPSSSAEGISVREFSSRLKGISTLSDWDSLLLSATSSC